MRRIFIVIGVVALLVATIEFFANDGMSYIRKHQPKDLRQSELRLLIKKSHDMAAWKESGPNGFILEGTLYAVYVHRDRRTVSVYTPSDVTSVGYTILDGECWREMSISCDSITPQEWQGLYDFGNTLWDLRKNSGIPPLAVLRNSI